MKNLNKTTLAALLATLLLTACGGSDDSNDNSVVIPPVVDGGGNGNGGDDNDGDDKDEHDYSKNGVFLPIVKDARQHFDPETNSNLVVKDYFFEYLGTTEKMLYIQDFEWNGQKLTMPFTKFLAEIGHGNYEEVLTSMFNECENDFEINQWGGFRIRCGGVDINGDNITYSIYIGGRGEYREHINTWLYDEPTTVLIRNEIEVGFSTIVDYIDDPSVSQSAECVYRSNVITYTEERGNETPEVYKFLYTITPDTFYCGSEYYI